MLNYIRQPRWILLHLIAIAFSAGFLRLGWWQWQARNRIDLQSGEVIIDWQNTFYAFQWLAFALFVVWFWWKFLSDGFKLENLRNDSEISDN